MTEGTIRCGADARIGAALLVVLLAWPAAICRGAETVSVFVGAFGETLIHDPQDRVEAEMRGPVEVVRAYSSGFFDPVTRNSVSPRRATAKDFIPGNYHALGLAQLLVIPKSAPGGFKSLSAIRSEKMRELAASGVAFTIQPSPDFASAEGSFELLVSTPYLLRQTYIEAKGCFFILTSGRTDRARDIGNSLRASLSDYLRKSTPPQLQPIQKDWAELKDVSLFGWGGWALVMLGASLMASVSLLSKNRMLRRLSVIGRSVIVSTNVFIFCGVMVLSALRMTGWLPSGGACALALGVVAPWLYPALARRLGGRCESLLWRGGLFAFTLFVLWADLRVEMLVPPRDLSYYASEQMGQAFWIGGIFGVLNGLCFGFSYAPAETEGDAHS